MNYRHAFHAGNLADVMKHVLLTRILVHLRAKPAPFRYVDTHAGIGLYDLAGPEAERTGEWRMGVGRLDEPFAPEVEALLAPYREVVALARSRHGAVAYPGSPFVAASLLRRDDRAILVEKHPADRATLAARLGRAPGCKVLELDGWTALGSLVPPPERRGLVLIDPPYEEPGEMVRAGRRLKAALRKWPTGIFALWYPVKIGTTPDEAIAELGPGRSPHLRLELVVARPDQTTGLCGSGLVICNPPWTLETEAEVVLPALAERLSWQGYAGFRCDRLP